jgi:manganese transport system permease protein
MTLLAVTSSVLSSVLGVFISYWTDSSTAGCIVLAQTAQFVLAFLLAPGQGVLRRL